MKKSLLVTLLIISITVTNLFSQSYLGKNRSLQLSESDMKVLYNGQGDLQNLADFFFNKSFSDIQKLVKSKNLYPEVEESNFYIDGKRVRMDMNMMGQKAAFIINLDTKKAYNIMYSQKMYVEMNISELKAMKEKMKEQMSAQMESMKGMMENLPPDAKAAMQEMYGDKETSSEKVIATGKSKTVNGFSCKEYLIVSNDEQEQVWVTSKYPAVKTAFYEIANIMPGDDDESIKWEQTDGWPVQTSQIRAKKGYVEGSFNISETYSIEKATHATGIFDPPKGFKKRSMQEMMMPGSPQMQ